MMKRFVFICLFLCAAFQVQAREPGIVKVGGYAFPPFVDVSGKQTAGITIDLIRELNTVQDRYRFEFVPTSPKRRYHDFLQGAYDIIFFENILWGWEALPMDISKVFLTGGEVYIAKALPDRGQTYFDNLEGKSKTGILGYHYGFANFDASPVLLKDKYQMQLQTDHRLLIDTVLNGKADIAVVTASYLSYYLKRHPDVIPRLLISKKYDQAYRHTALIRKGTRPGADEINRLLDILEQNGRLKTVWEKYGIPSLREFRAQSAPLVIGVSFAIPPYVIKETDQGIELDILRQAFGVSAHQIRIKFLPLIRTFSLLEAGRIDGIINIKEGMVDNVFYSDEVITFQNCAISLTRRGYPDFKSLSFLKDKYIIAFQRATDILGEDFAGIAAGNERYEEVAAQENQVIRLFLERKADLVVMEKQIFNYYRKKILEAGTIGRKAEAAVTYHEIFPPTHYRFAFRSRQIRDDFNHGLKTIRQNSQYNRIMDKYQKLMAID